jgi:hypothetical protein
MRKTLTTFVAFALLAGVAAGCSDSGQSGKLGERPSREQPPAASPPTNSPTAPSTPTPPPTR